jgi:hypothetical protein
MLHLEDLLVDGRIRCREPIEGASEFERAVQIGWAMPSGPRKAKSGIAADAHGVSISPHEPAAA